MREMEREFRACKQMLTDLMSLSHGGGGEGGGKWATSLLLWRPIETWHFSGSTCLTTGPPKSGKIKTLREEIVDVNPLGARLNRIINICSGISHLMRRIYGGRFFHADGKHLQPGDVSGGNSSKDVFNYEASWLNGAFRNRKELSAYLDQGLYRGNYKKMESILFTQFYEDSEVMNSYKYHFKGSLITALSLSSNPESIFVVGIIMIFTNFPRCLFSPLLVDVGEPQWKARNRNQTPADWWKQM